MDLFKTSLAVQQTDLNPLTYSTPFGDVYFDLTINEKKIKNFKPFKTVAFKKQLFLLGI